MDIGTLYRIYLEHPYVTTDSRHCPAGCLFFALKGETFNGNAFAVQALKDGAEYAVIDEAEYAEPENKRLILVDNSLQTLQDLARYHRRQLKIKVIGITGTNGKTTTKELIAAVLSKEMKVLYTQGNLNNHIGVPLTLLRLTPEHDIAVIEMGANHPGEIKTLAHIAEPDYGIITNVGKAHLEGFGSFEGVIRTKGELYDFLRSKQNSVAFIHKENTHLLSIADGLNPVFYGQANDLYINGQAETCDPFLAFRWKAGTNGEPQHVKTRLIGEYNLENALAAVTIGHFFGINAGKINRALEEYTPRNNRSQLKETANNRLIIDAYNANPTSMSASLRNFRNLAASHKTVILGDMKELGESSLEEHRKVIEIVRNCRFEKVYLVGEQFEKACSFYRTEGTGSTRNTERNKEDKEEMPGSWEIFPDVEALITALRKNQPQGMCILIKGSNSMKLVQVAEYL